MSSPLFIQSPICDPAEQIAGATDLSLPDQGYDLTTIREEASLIEEISYCVNEEAADPGGQVMVVLVTGDPGYEEYTRLGVWTIGSGAYASGRIPINVQLPAGTYLRVAHNLTGGGGPLVHFVAHGGVLG